MTYLSDDDIHLKFLLGLPVHIYGIGDFNAPLLIDVVNATESIYNQAISTILLTKDKLKNTDDLENYSELDIVSTFALHDGSFRELFFYGLKLHLNESPTIHEKGFMYFGELSDSSILTYEKFMFIRRLIRIANNIQEAQKKEDEFIPGNEQARKFMEELKRNEELLAQAKRKDSKPINLHSLISSVGWKAKNFNFINQLNIYQLYNGYFRLSTIDNYHYTMTGLYSGTIDSKSVKLPEINWANIIKTN